MSIEVESLVRCKFISRFYLFFFYLLSIYYLGGKIVWIGEASCFTI